MKKRIKNKKSQVAVFDIDGTIFRSSLQRELIMELVKYGVFPPIVKKELEKDFFSWVDRRGSYEDYIMGVVNSYEKRIPGVSVEDVRHVARIVIGKQKNRVYTFTRDLIKKLRPTHHLVAISGSPIEIVKEFNRIWRFDKVYGMEFEIKDERYTGKVNFLPITDKRAVLTNYVKQKKLSLFGSVGVGDTENDAGFLSLVKKPICFNPNHDLYSIARKKSWAVVVERKDVIYHL
ncbi:HAD-IB family phosphatase [Patescibacteria group bacterium]|nr:HAD-IB family phosphatase [Patescibacteria group bacterium]